jgi:hypothetical protein
MARKRENLKMDPVEQSIPPETYIKEIQETLKTMKSIMKDLKSNSLIIYTSAISLIGGVSNLIYSYSRYFEPSEDIARSRVVGLGYKAL